MKHILSWDVGYVNHGLALFEYDIKNIKLLKSKSIEYKEKNESKKLYQIKTDFKRRLEKYKPDILVYENPVIKNGNVGFKLAKVLGIIIVECYELEILLHPYSAAEVKKCIANNGRCSKEDIQTSVNKILKINKTYDKDHESDAIAIGLTWYFKNVKNPC